LSFVFTDDLQCYSTTWERSEERCCVKLEKFDGVRLCNFLTMITYKPIDVEKFPHALVVKKQKITNLLA